MIVTQNALRPGVQPYVLSEMTEGDFRLIMYLTKVQRFTINTPTVFDTMY